MDPDVARLVREERLLEAAGLASQRGDPRAASAIYERACEWRSAAVEAVRAGDVARALALSAQAGDQAIFDEVAAKLALNSPVAQTVAADLTARGQDRWAARVLERCGDPLDAARAWERAGDGLRAATLLERGGAVADAERVLQGALRRDPEEFDVAVRLGALLMRLGKWEAAVRALQRVPSNAQQRAEALSHLGPALAEFGLTHAARHAAIELTALGQASAAAHHRGDSNKEAEGFPVGCLGGASVAPPIETRYEQPAMGGPPSGTLLFGRYELVSEIASSPSARVVECIDVIRGDRVAVKLFTGEGALGSGRDALARFAREVRAMRALDHPNIVPVRDVVAEPPALILDWMPGGTLERLLAAPETIAPARAVEIVSSVLSALGAAHRLGILHRDVKPANVLFDEAGGARLGDFGVAHLGDVSATATAGIFGTVAYMSPEQREARPATVRSDLFGVGVMLRQMLTGEAPIPDRAPTLLPSHAHPELDARHDALIGRMTAREARERPADAIEAREMLAALSWPATVRSRSTAPRLEQPSSAASGDRLEPLADGRLLDRWTGRRLERLPLTDGALARARAFALADHEALQSVLRVDTALRAIWLEALDAPTLHRPLAPHERARLQSALAALHAAGGIHGHVDAHHVVVAPAGVVLRFHPECDPEMTPDRDDAALARI